MTFWTQGPQKPAVPRVLEEYGTGAALGAAAEEGFVNNPVMSLLDGAVLNFAQFGRPIGSHAGPRARPDSELMSATEANHWFGIPGELNFDQPVRARAAQIRYAWKKAELRRRDILNRASDKTLAQAARLGASFLAQAVDPINIASAFIPVVGEARYARMLAVAATRSSPALARAGVRAGVGMLEGAVGAALVEPLVYQGARLRGQEYDLWDSLANVGFGTALGGGLHSIGGAGADGVRAAIGRRRTRTRTAGEELVGEIGMPAHAAATQGAIAAVAEGRPVHIAEVLEAQQLGAAYDAVRANPQGPALDPLVRITPDDIEATALARGGWNGIGDVEVKGAGFGLAKIIWRHGEEGPKAPAEQVTREDVLAFPTVIRRPETLLHRSEDGLRREWLVRRADGAAVLYADKAMEDGGRHVMTIHVIRPEALTQKIESRRPGDPGSPGRAFQVPPRDTGAAPFGQQPPGQVLPAGSSIADAVRAGNATDPAEAQAILRIAAEVEPSLKAPEDVQAEIASQQALLADERAMLGEDLDAGDRAVLAEADALEKAAAEEGRAYDAAAACFIRSAP